MAGMKTAHFSFRFLVYCGLVYATAFAVADPVDSRTAEDRRVFADALYKRELYAQAAKEYRSLVQAFPNQADADEIYFRMGEAFRLSGDAVAAIEAFTPVAYNEASPWRESALFKRAYLFMVRNQALDVVEMLTDLLKIAKKPEIREMSLYYRASALEQIGKTEEAIADLEQQLREYPNGVMRDNARLSLGRIFSLPGKYHDSARAISLLREIAKAPSAPRLGAEAVFLLASNDFSNKDYKAAADGFARLFKEYPDDSRIPEARIRAAWAFCNGGRYQEAIAMAEEARKAPGVSAADAIELRYIGAQAQFLLSNFEQAGKQFAEIAALPDAQKNDFGIRAAYQTALCHFKRNDYVACLEAIRPVLSVAKIREDALWLYAESSMLAGEEMWDNAVEGYRLITTEYPDSAMAADALFRLGDLYQKRGNWQDASIAYHQLTETYPKSELAPKALFASAIALTEAGKHEKALVEWMTFLRNYAQHELVSEALFRQGCALILLGRNLEALDSFDRLLREFPKTRYRAEAFYWRGVLLRDGKDYPGAIQAFRDALAAQPSEETRLNVRFALALALQANEQELEASQLLQELLEGPARDRFTYAQLRWLAEYQYSRENYEGASQTARILIQKASGDVKLQIGWALVGRAERALNHPEEAEKAFRMACNLPVYSVLSPESNLRLGELLLARGSADEAIQHFRTTIKICKKPELQPFRTHAYIGLGEAELARGNEETALRYWMTTIAMTEDPELIPPVLEKAIRLAESLGRADDAAFLQKEMAKYGNRQ